ncbi:MAG: hypothetical protein UR94_C0013G0011 [Parcubacteria group bacterium GW2011_GWA2_36_10]|nr:MAG: hypothetical protein UR94_C0013G0011 [Parcubacteria group bacterium GW2011_GWA2_36_10]
MIPPSETVFLNDFDIGTCDLTITIGVTFDTIDADDSLTQIIIEELKIVVVVQDIAINTCYVACLRANR